MEMVWIAAGFAVLWLTAALAFVLGAGIGRRRGLHEAVGRGREPRIIDLDCCQEPLQPPADRNRLRRT
jgi:hypothetical protein